MKTRTLITFFFLIAPFLVNAQRDTVPDVKALLGLSLEELMDIKVVTASGYLQTTSEAPSTITVISSQQIAERGYEQLEDALRDIPGIDMIHLNGYAPTLVYFRGMYGAENLRALFMIDGIVENNIIGSNDMAGPAYSLHNVDRIEIIWGPASALYGANAFGGVINIITKKGGDINGFKAEQGFGSFNTSFENVALGLKKGNWEIAFSGSLYNTEGPKFINRDPNYTASYVKNAYSFNSSISYLHKNSKTTLGFRTYHTPMGWGTFFNSPTVFLGLPSQGNGNKGIIGLIARDVRSEKSGLEEPYSRTFFLQSQIKPTSKLTMIARATYTETGISDKSYAYITLDGRKLIRAITTSYSNRIGAEFTINYLPSANNNLSAGIQYFRDNVESGSRKATIDTNTIFLIDGRFIVTNLFSTFKERVYDIRNNFGSYLQYVLNTKFLDKTNFTFGIRDDYNSYFGNSVSPRVVIVNQAVQKTTFKLQFGKAFRAPTNTEIYQAPPNFKLKTEKINTYEANIIYTASKSLRVQLNGFHNKLKDVILLGNLSGLTTDKNPGVFTITGAESILDIVLSKNIFGFLNFTYQHATGKNIITNVSGRLPGVAKMKGNAGFTIHVDDLFTISFIENWIGKRPVPRTDPYGPVKGYFLTNLTIRTKELFEKRIIASLNIRNVFNTKWLDPGFRTADGLIYSTVLEQPGINVMFKIGISL